MGSYSLRCCVSNKYVPRLLVCDVEVIRSRSCTPQDLGPVGVGEGELCAGDNFVTFLVFLRERNATLYKKEDHLRT